MATALTQTQLTAAAGNEAAKPLSPEVSHQPQRPLRPHDKRPGR